MKILTNKEYKELLAHKQGNEYRIKQIDILENKLKLSQDLKEVLVELANKTGLPQPKYGENSLTVDLVKGVSFTNSSVHLDLPDNILQYVDDILGGKVIKQEGTKCLVIDKDGNVKTGLTKQKPDKNYSYKLVR